MQQLEISEYVVADGEAVNVKIDDSSDPESQTWINVLLDSDPLRLENKEFEFAVSGDQPSHKLLIEFMPRTQNATKLRLLLKGSAGGGEYNVPIELFGGMTQTRYFRFNVAGRAMSLGVG